LISPALSLTLACSQTSSTTATRPPARRAATDNGGGPLIDALSAAGRRRPKTIPADAAVISMGSEGDFARILKRLPPETRPTRTAPPNSAGTKSPARRRQLGRPVAVHAGVPADRRQGKSTVKCRGADFRDGRQGRFTPPPPWPSGWRGCATGSGSQRRGHDARGHAGRAALARDTYGTSKAAAPLLGRGAGDQDRAHQPGSAAFAGIKATGACAPCSPTKRALLPP